MRDVLRDRQQWARNGMVTTGSPAASLAALDVLRDGGTAFDAAVTASAVMTVVLPMASGPAGDAAIVCQAADSAEPVSLTALGRAPSGATAAAYARRGLRDVPQRGVLSVSSPALIDSWLAVHRRYGTLGIDRLLEPAIRLAEDGVVVTGQAARWGRDNLTFLQQPYFQKLYGVYGSPDAVGSTIRQPGLARLYRTVVEGAGRPEQLRRTIGAAVAAVGGELGGLIDAGDCLTDHARFEPAPVVRMGDRVVATTAAPTQGPLLLQNLALFRRLRGTDPVDTAAGIHLLAEIANQTYGWRLDAFGDPDFVPATGFLDDRVLNELAARVDRDKLSPPRCLGQYTQGDTTHFAVIDSTGNGVSWVQSLGLGFGAGVGVPEYGLLLCDRLGRSSTLRPGTPNCVEGGKRPVNTILPWLVGGPEGVRWLGGTPGGDGQTQWNAQVITRLVDDGLSPLAALSRPRWTYYPGSDKVEAEMGLQLRVDADLSADILDELRTRGHQVVPKASIGGGMRLVERRSTFVYGLDDGRHEGLTIGW